MNNTMPIYYVLIIATLALPSFLNAKIYTWVDDEGKTHFSDKKITSDGNEKEVELKPVNSIHKPAKEIPDKEASNNSNSYKKQLEERKKKRAQEIEERAKIRKKANSWQKKYCSYKSVFARHGRVNPNGTREVITEKRLVCSRKVPKKYALYVR
jgi:hypothetical protein